MKQKTERPRIKIKPEPVDWVIEIVGALGILLLIGLPVYYYNSLPDIIPRHYGLSGKPDAYSAKGVIWILPAIGVVMYACMFILNRFPHAFNYPGEITTENASRQYKMAQRLLRMVNAGLAWTFCYLTFATIRTALQKQDGLGGFFTPVFLALIFGPIGIYLYLATRKKEPESEKPWQRGEKDPEG